MYMNSLMSMNRMPGNWIRIKVIEIHKNVVKSSKLDLLNTYTHKCFHLFRSLIVRHIIKNVSKSPLVKNNDDSNKFLKS